MRMPRSLYERHPVWCATLVALVLRLVAARGYAYFASDDYVYALEPAWQWLAEPAAPFSSHYRSLLFPRAVWALFVGARALGLTDPAAIVRFAYAALGLWSLAVVPGTYYLARARLGEPAARAAMWLAAAQALMPRLATRTLIEVAAMPPLVWSLVLFESARTLPRRRHAALAAMGSAVLLGFAAMLRFHVGLLVLPLGIVLVWPCLRGLVRRQPGVRAAFAGTAPVFALWLLGLGLAAAAQALLDLATHGAALASPWRYLTFNLRHSSDFGTSSWTTYLVFFALLTVPPVTLWLARPLARAFVMHPSVAAALATFVAVHSLIGHKEERFMFPVLPLFFVLAGAGLAAMRKSTPGARRAYAGFIVVNVLGLALATASDSHRALVDPLLEAGRAGAVRALYVGRPQLVPSLYFGSRRDVVAVTRASELEGRDWPDGWTRVLGEPGTRPNLAALGWRCGETRESQGDLVDRALLALNPHNKRRGALAVTDCEKGSPAGR